jgi:hypothetical protein
MVARNAAEAASSSLIYWLRWLIWVWSARLLRVVDQALELSLGVDGMRHGARKPAGFNEGTQG